MYLFYLYLSIDCIKPVDLAWI